MHNPYVQQYTELIKVLKFKSSYQWHSVLFHIVASILNNLEDIDNIDILNREFHRFVSTADVIIDGCFDIEYDLKPVEKINLLYELLYNKITSAEEYFFNIYIDFFTDFYQRKDDELNFDKNIRDFLEEYMQGYSNDDEMSMMDRIELNLDIAIHVQKWMIDIS